GIVEKINRLCIDSTFSYPLVIEDGKGCYIRDPDGNIFLDFTSNIGSSPLGYSHPAILEVIKEYSKNGAHKIAGQDFYCKEHADIAEKLLNIVPDNFRAFFINSGAEAVENAIKLAYRKTGKKVGISCYGAFHGRTLGALTFTYSKPVQKKNYPELPVRRIKFCVDDNDPSIDDIDDLIDDEVAFIITEIVQGEGGYNIASKRFIEKLYKTAKEYNIPLIIDEVQSGMGRTGRWWAFEHYNVRPDIMSIAKALQVGATVFDESFTPERGALSSTWGGGDRIDLAVGSRIIDTIIKDRLIDNARDMGNLLLKRLKELGLNARGLGLMIGIEFDTKEVRDKVITNAFKNGLLLLQAGEKTVRIIPPLIINEEEVNEGIDILSRVIRSL
ncbi:MAG: aminotransferase class III-fold pyridoxal phosphate-dependent enzyme, partial [Candidatus Nitrosothermus koennekii]